jgi:uncharacterized membrane protein
VKKELIIFGIVFLISTLGMHHKEWFSHPVEHLMHLPNAGAYGVGAIHPIIFTLVIYLLVWIPRGIVRLFRKKKEQ